MIPGFLQLDDLSPQHNELHRKALRFGLPLLDEVTATIPTANTLPVGFCQFYRSGTTYRLYFNFNAVLYYTALTAA